MKTSQCFLNMAVLIPLRIQHLSSCLSLLKAICQCLLHSCWVNVESFTYTFILYRVNIQERPTKALNVKSVYSSKS